MPLRTPYSVIEAKKRGNALSEDDFAWFLDQFLKDEIPDYQMAALLMAIFFQGLSPAETSILTKLMMESGKQIPLNLPGPAIDKHSTGGLGDKASFIIAPLAAACGVYAPMIAGRGLGHTGGTIDKMQSVPGWKTDLSREEFLTTLNEVGCAVMGQTNDIAPADKRLYALRDVTATVDSVELITASILSKKLAVHSNGLVMDVKVGTGALMTTFSGAEALANSIVATAREVGRPVRALITDMNQPLGSAVGNGLEILESIEALKNQGPEDLKKLCTETVAHMICLANPDTSLNQAQELAKTNLENGKALDHFEKLMLAQGVAKSPIKNIEQIDIAPKITTIKSTSQGHFNIKNAQMIGHSLIQLKGGRLRQSDQLDYGTGFKFLKRIGDPVQANDSLIEIYHREKQDISIAHEILHEEVIEIESNKIQSPPLIHKVVI